MKTNYAELKSAQLLETQTDIAVGNQQPEVVEIQSNGSETSLGVVAPQTEVVKICSMCKTNPRLDNHNQCRTCRSKTNRKYRQTSKGKNAQYASRNKWLKQNRKSDTPEKRKAHRTTFRTKGTKLNKCSICDINENIRHHHPDYSKPEYTIPLCEHHHKLVHIQQLNTADLATILQNLKCE